jgi:NADPH:quinone reductase-like Zn-dependent oxidoreductase
MRRIFSLKNIGRLIAKPTATGQASCERERGFLLMDIQDKVVIIIGASEGIGLATAHLFAEAGAKVALAARSADTPYYHCQ